MAKLGMDVEVIGGLADQLDAQASHIAGTIGTVENLVRRAAADWRGDTAQRFAGDWYARYKPALQRAHDSIAGLATSARNNAHEQANASGLGVGSYGPARRDEVGLVLDALGLGMFVNSGVGLIKALLEDTKGVGPLAGEAVKLSKWAKFGGGAMAGLSIAIDGASLVHDIRANGVNDQSYNDELNLYFDVAAGAALFIPGVGPLVSLGIGAVGFSVDSLEHFDPTLTADAFKMSPIGVEQDIVGTTVTNFSHGDYNPLDVATAVGGNFVHNAEELGAHALGDLGVKGAFQDAGDTAAKLVSAGVDSIFHL